VSFLLPSENSGNRVNEELSTLPDQPHALSLVSIVEN